ncbi:MAG: ATPase [Muribaculaceae bacterium]|nr:ATPase [Muribaculaceae bacterium]
MQKCLYMAVAAALIISSVYAQEKHNFKVTPTGRILVDGALYATPQKESFPDGMSIPEVRLGGKLSYDNWSAMIDASYAYNKIGLRNAWIEYSFSPGNSLRVGNFIHQYGLQSNSSSQKCTMEQPVASALFTPGLQLGAMFVHYSRAWYVAGSFHVESNALKEMMNAPLFNQQGYGILTRLAWRKSPSPDKVLHLGISGGFATPQRRLENGEDVHDGFVTSANFPTKVVQKQAVGATVTDARNLFKFTPELLLASGRLAFEAQYFFQQINRRDNPDPYISQSGYATLRGQVIGKGYSYSSSTAMLANPAPKTLECVLNYNYSTLSDAGAAIFGGRANSMGVTFNYYFNPYITARLNYNYTHTWDRTGENPASLNTFQARLMVLF